LGPETSFYRKSKINVKRKPNYEIGWFHNGPMIISHTGAYEGFFRGGSICARKRAKKIFGPPTWQHCAPPLKTPFWKKC